MSILSFPAPWEETNPGPQHLKYTVDEPMYMDVVTQYKFEDGRVAFNQRAPKPPRTWTFVYEGLVDDTGLTEVTDPLRSSKILDDHRDSTFGGTFGFNFTDRDGKQWTNVHYLQDKTSKFHTQHRGMTQTRTVTLIKYPDATD